MKIIGKTYRNYSDEALFEACREGSRHAQKELYERYCAQMKGICMRYAPSEDDAEDLLQESFIRIFRGLNSYQSKGTPGGWIRTVTIHTAIEHYRKQATRKHHYDNYQELNEDRTVDFDRLSLDELLAKIQGLPDGFRVVFNLYAIEGYNHREIGEKLGISEGTSKSQYSRARKFLQDQIEAEAKYELKQLKHVK